jgi:hypothetical protein
VYVSVIFAIQIRHILTGFIVAARRCMHVCVFMKEVYVFFVFAMQITCAHGGHSCCKVMHACIGVCVMVCIRHMFTMIAAGLCVLVCTRHMLTVIAARRCMHVQRVCFGCTRRSFTETAVRRCCYVHICVHK